MSPVSRGRPGSRAGSGVDSTVLSEESRSTGHLLSSDATWHTCWTFCAEKGFSLSAAERSRQLQKEQVCFYQMEKPEEEETGKATKSLERDSCSKCWVVFSLVSPNYLVRVRPLQRKPSWNEVPRPSGWPSFDPFPKVTFLWKKLMGRQIPVTRGGEGTCQQPACASRSSRAHAGPTATWWVSVTPATAAPRSGCQSTDAPKIVFLGLLDAV